MGLTGLLFRDVLLGNYCPLWNSQAADQIKRLYDLFLKVDATQVEVNPLGETPEGQGRTFFLFLVSTYQKFCLSGSVYVCSLPLFLSHLLSHHGSVLWDFRYCILQHNTILN